MDWLSHRRLIGHLHNKIEDGALKGPVEVFILHLAKVLLPGRPHTSLMISI
jgi:hypothetical protein